MNFQLNTLCGPLMPCGLHTQMIYRLSCPNIDFSYVGQFLHSQNRIDVLH